MRYTRVRNPSCYTTSDKKSVSKKLVGQALLTFCDVV